MRDCYHVALHVAGRKCVVVGGGDVALRKAEALAAAGAEVWAVAPEVHSSLRENSSVQCVEAAYDPSHLHGAMLVIAATDDAVVNRRVSEDAESRGILVNVVDQPDLCSFIVPASVKRGDLCIAISTGGSSPALARRIREQLDEQFGPEYAEYLEALRQIRTEVLRDVHEASVRREILKALPCADVLDVLRRDGRQAAEERMREIVRHALARANSD